MKRGAVWPTFGAHGGKTRLAAHAMVNAIFAGSVGHVIRIMAPTDEGAARLMEAFYEEWNDQMWERA